MNPYITFRDKDKNNELQYYILQRDFPHYCGQLVTFPQEGVICQSALPGYNLWITFAGTIRGNFVPSYPNEQQARQAIFDSMANWFYEQRVLIEEKRYKKFKITNNAAIPNQPDNS